MKNNKKITDNLVLLFEWNWEKNDVINIKPDNVSLGSGIKVWWKCKEGHEWQATPNHRSNGRGCPICAKYERAKSHSNNWIELKGSLEKNNPILASEWHPTKNGDLLPSQITVNNGKKVWWMCSNGHEWQAIVKSRNYGSGCPVCSGHKILIGYNDLATVNPKLASEWHPTKNNNLKPTDVTQSNGKKVWWLCKKGHEWEAQISNRTNGDSCPICSGKKVLIGYNDLATVNPKLASEWHPTKNNNLKPTDVTLKSNKIIWWQCSKGHEWQASISNRTSGTRCPICSGEQKTSFPEQAIYYYLNKIFKTYNRYKFNNNTEIDIYLPELKLGIEYDGIFFHNGKLAEEREKKKDKILIDNGITLIRVKESNEICESHDNIIYTESYQNDDNLTNMIYKLINHINKIRGLAVNIEVNIKNDRNNIYEQYIKIEKEKSLLEVNPSLASEWHPVKNLNLKPEHITANSNKKVWWLGKCGHEWEAVVNSRSSGIGCPICAGKQVLIGYNDLATLNPKLALEWHPIKNGKLFPTNVTNSSNKKVWWKCEKGHEYIARIYDRNSGRNCPICAGKQVLVGYNDLYTVNPKLASEWHPTKNDNLTPQNITSGSSKKVWWMCKKGHEWQAVISSRNAGYGCPYCAGQKALPGINDLSTTNPKLASEWHPTKNGSLHPSEVMAGSNKKVWWICEKGHEWQAVINSRNAGRGCPICYKNNRKNG